jgi:hypothetical protein
VSPGDAGTTTEPATISTAAIICQEIGHFVHMATITPGTSTTARDAYVRQQATGHIHD